MENPGLDGLTESVHARDGEARGWAPPHDWQTLRPGDHYTIAGVYRPRTWWEWLTLAPRPLRVWYVIKVY